MFSLLAAKHALWRSGRQKLVRKPLSHAGRRDLFTSLLLVTLLCRAYVPVGFMPGGHDEDAGNRGGEQCSYGT